MHPPSTEPRSRESRPASHTYAGLPAMEAASRDRIPSALGEPCWTKAQRRWSGACGSPADPQGPPAAGRRWRQARSRLMGTSGRKSPGGAALPHHAQPRLGGTPSGRPATLPRPRQVPVSPRRCEGGRRQKEPRPAPPHTRACSPQGQAQPPPPAEPHR